MKKNLQFKYPFMELLGELEQLLYVTGISKIDCNALIIVKERVQTLVISCKIQTSTRSFFS